MPNRQYIYNMQWLSLLECMGLQVVKQQTNPCFCSKDSFSKKKLQFIFTTCAMVVERRVSRVSRSEGARATHSAFPLLQMIELNYVCVNSLTGCPVPEFIDHVLSPKTSVFIKTSLKFSFSIQTLSGDIISSLFYGSFLKTVAA